MYNEISSSSGRLKMPSAPAMRGYPLTHALSNGASGLANTLIVSGFCYQKLGNFKAALTCFETSLINSKFEKKKAFRDFTKTFLGNLIACYENGLRLR